MISTPHRQQAVTLIEAARSAGARLQPACEVIGITIAYPPALDARRRCAGGSRSSVERPVPANALRAEETEAILAVCHQPAYASLPPDQIVVRLLDEEALYLGSVSTFYRVLRRHGELNHRGRAKAPKRYARPTTYHASGPTRSGHGTAPGCPAR